VKIHMMETQHFDTKTFNLSVASPGCLDSSLRHSHNIKTPGSAKEKK